MGHREGRHNNAAKPLPDAIIVKLIGRSLEAIDLARGDGQTVAEVDFTLTPEHGRSGPTLLAIAHHKALGAAKHVPANVSESSASRGVYAVADVVTLVDDGIVPDAHSASKDGVVVDGPTLNGRNLGLLPICAVAEILSSEGVNEHHIVFAAIDSHGPHRRTKRIRLGPLDTEIDMVYGEFITSRQRLLVSGTDQ